MLAGTGLFITEGELVFFSRILLVAAPVFFTVLFAANGAPSYGASSTANDGPFGTTHYGTPEYACAATNSSTFGLFTPAFFGFLGSSLRSGYSTTKHQHGGQRGNIYFERFHESYFKKLRLQTEL
jgi:hypothetical protein